MYANLIKKKNKKKLQNNVGYFKNFEQSIPRRSRKDPFPLNLVQEKLRKPCICFLFIVNVL